MNRSNETIKKEWEYPESPTSIPKADDHTTGVIGIIGWVTPKPTFMQKWLS